MKPPIIVNNFGDMMFFASVEEMQQYLEAIDVKNNEYIAYDSEGRLIILGTTKSQGLLSSERVIVQGAESEPTHASELQKTLLDFFTRVRLSKDWLASASLQDLVRKGLEQHRTR